MILACLGSSKKARVGLQEREGVGVIGDEI